MSTTTAVNAPTQFIETNGRKIAYRSIGSGKPIILSNRFRGNLDCWDPLFLDELAKGYNVIIFDPTGLSSSTGKPSTSIVEFAKDIGDLAEALGLKKIILGGWSFGGMAAQTAFVLYPDLISHLILIGTNPPGQNEHPFEAVFFEVSRKVVNDLDDEIILFFEPDSEKSKKNAKLSHDRIAARISDIDPPVAEPLWNNYTLGVVDFVKDELEVRKKISETNIPILVLSGDHDLCFPVENWFALNRKTESVQVIVLPKTGHGPQHEYPELSAHYIKGFIEYSL